LATPCSFGFFRAEDCWCGGHPCLRHESTSGRRTGFDSRDPRTIGIETLPSAVECNIQDSQPPTPNPQRRHDGFRDDLFTKLNFLFKFSSCVLFPHCSSIGIRHFAPTTCHFSTIVRHVLDMLVYAICCAIIVVKKVRLDLFERHVFHSLIHKNGNDRISFRRGGRC
jgi:hypothetical protein